MSSEDKKKNKLIELLAENLDIPRSHYQKAADRYQSLADWLHRETGSLARLDPVVFPQGSFRLGLVTRPLIPTDAYDLDLVCRINLSKDHVSQKNVKDIVGKEIAAYATANSFKDRPIEKPRCWRLNYADIVSFHMDILPAIPDVQAASLLFERFDVPMDLTSHALSITDNRLPTFEQILSAWPTSNPKGFALWFEKQIEPVAKTKRRLLVERGEYASIEEVPAYEWKTPLQLSIQILKRHRDVMFHKSPDIKPISMIITTLTARSYRGQAGVYETLLNVLEAMPSHVNHSFPRVPNPVNPGEDFADKWQANPQLEQNFWRWHAQALADVQSIVASWSASDIISSFERKFEIHLDQETQRVLNETISGATPRKAPVIHIRDEAPKPWRRGK